MAGGPTMTDAKRHGAPPSTPSKRAAIGDLRLLWADNVPKRCQAKVLDTVLFKDAKPYRWLFTNKNVQVSKKKEQNLTLNSIRDRFVRLADVLSNDEKNSADKQKSHKVAVVYTTDGSRMELDRESFEELLTTSSDGKALHGVAALQACMPTKMGSKISKFQSEYRFDGAPGSGAKIVTKGFVKGKSVASESQDVNTELEGALGNAVKFIEETGHVKVKQLTGNFVADGNGMLWLSDFHNMSLEPRADSPTEHSNTEVGPTSSHGTSVRLLAMKREREQRERLVETEERVDGSGGGGGHPQSASRTTRKSKKEHSSRGEGQVDKLAAIKAKAKSMEGRSLRKSEPERPGFPGSRGKGKNKMTSMVSYNDDGDGFEYEQVEEGDAHVPAPFADGFNAPLGSKTDTMLKSGMSAAEADLLTRQSQAAVHESNLRSANLERELSDMSEKVDKLEARLRAESTVNARLTERLQALRKEAHHNLTKGKEHDTEVMGRLQRALELANTQCQESDDRCSALTLKITEYEASMSQMSIRLESETKAADREGSRAKELAKKLANTQREFARAMREKDEHVRREVLATEERMHREMSMRPGSSEAAPGSPTAKALIRTVEELNKKLAAQHAEHASLQAELVTRNRLELLEKEEEFQKQSNMDRQNVQEMEDRVQELQSQMCVMVKDVSVSKKREEELNRRLQSVESKKNQVEKDLAVAQQSLNALKTMGDGMAGSADSQQASQVSAMKATSEAKIRQLNNEVDFLRAQLTSEIQCRSELETNVQQVNEKYLISKEKWENALSDSEMSKREAIRELENRFRQELLVPQEEVHRLEDKVQALQKNLGEMVKDLSLARKQTESLSRAKQALVTERDGLQDRVAHYVNEIQSMKTHEKESRSKNTAEAAFRTTVETDMRKLQHEVEYLRSQLSSEIRCKEDLETAMAQAEQQMDDQARQHARELEEQSAKVREENSQTVKRESMLRDTKIALEGEVLNLSKQLADMKKSYAKLRDQHRVDVGQLDATKQSASRLEVALQNARSTLKREKNAAESAQTRHERAMAAIQQTVKEMSDAKNAAIRSAEEQIKSNMAKVSATQREMLVLKDAMKHENRQHQKLIATERMVNGLQIWLMNRSKEKFDKWKQAFYTAKLAEHKDAEYKIALEKERQQAKQDKDRTCALLLEEYRQNKDSAIVALRKMEDSRRNENAMMGAEDVRGHLMREADRQQQSEEFLASQHNEHVQNINTLHEENVATLQSEFEEASAIAREDAKNAQLAAIKATETEAARQQEAALDLAEKAAEEARQRQAEVAAAKLCEAVATAESALKAMHNDQTNRTKLEHAKELQRASDRLRATREDMQKEQEKALALAGDQAMKAQKHALEVMALQKQKELEVAIAQQIAARHAEVNDLKKQFEQEKSDALKQSATQFEEQLAAQRHKARETLTSELAKSAAERESMLEELREKADKMKTAALQYQTSKWQSTLKECMAEAEKDKAKLQAEMIEKQKEAVRIEHESGENRKEEALKQAEVHLKKSLEKAEAEAGARQEAALKDLGARRQAAMEGALERARAHAETQLQQKQLDHEEIMRQKEAAFEETTIGAFKLAETKQKHAVAQAEAKAAAERDAALRRAVAESKRRADTVRSECLKEQERVVADLMNKHNEAMANLAEAARTEKEKALKDLADRARRELDHAVQMLEKQREKQVARLTDALQKSEQEKQEAREDLDQVRDQLEESEDQNYDLKNQLTGTRRVGVMQRLYLIKSKITEAQNEKKLLGDMRREADARVKELSKQKEKELSYLRDKNRILDAEVRLHEETRAAMHDTLVNHKRAMLMEHKVQSTVLQKDLAALIEQKSEIDKQRDALVKENSRLEGTVKEIERQIHEMSKQSAIQDGRINVAHAKKKRRLDQEFERVLERVQEKRDHLARVEKKLQQIDDARQDKEDEMKELERNLVQLLVEQQKKLLAVLQTSKTNTRKNSQKSSDLENGFSEDKKKLLED
jgi:chromosome segregation ATPase